ncbi:MAG: HAD family phosphatase [Lachnospiraceae bacterium]|nr:HAD family phosphatase [Lachnospiraceae bacterium]
MKIEAIFFDFDGVIADTETVWMNCACDYCKDRGNLSDREILFSFAGDGDVELLRYLSEGGTFGQEEILTEIKGRFERASGKISIRPGIEEYLRFAREQNLKLALVSNSGQDYIDRWLERLGLQERFDCVVTRSVDIPMKPAPDLYLLALSRLGVRPEKTVAFEDSVLGMRAARAAGLRAVAYPNEVTEKEIHAQGFFCTDLGTIAPKELLTQIEKVYDLEESKDGVYLFAED